MINWMGTQGDRNNDDNSLWAKSTSTNGITATINNGMANLGCERYHQQQNESQLRSIDTNLYNEDNDEDDVLDSRNEKKSKRKMRFAPHQLQALESLFKDWPHPTETQKLELSQRLSLDITKVKFWFQNRRTQIKTKMERHEQTLLAEKNEKLRTENSSLQSLMKNRPCNKCRKPAFWCTDNLSSLEEQTLQYLRNENVGLREEVGRVYAIADKLMGGRHLPVLQLPPSPPPLPASLSVGVSGGSGMEGNWRLMQVGITAMHELLKMVQMEKPLWGPATLQGDVITETLYYDEYMKAFPCSQFFTGLKPATYVSEATRSTGIVKINCMDLVDILMDPVRWGDAFPSLIGRSATKKIVSSGMDGTKDGALYLMNAEIQVISPLVPIQELHFLRFSKQQSEGVWVVVDVSVDTEGQLPCSTESSESVKYRRLPSGCVIQEVSSGYFKVTWVEHVEYDESLVHELYQPLLWSGTALGAKRWVATLQRYCDYVAIDNLISTISATPDDRPNNCTAQGIQASGKRYIMKLAKQMTHNFCAGVCKSSEQNWINLDNDPRDGSRSGSGIGIGGEGQVRVTMRTQTTEEVGGVGAGVLLCAATSVWLPLVSPQPVFDFLRDVKLRYQWHILSDGGPVQEVVHFLKGINHADVVSLHKTPPTLMEDAIANGNQQRSSMLILQDTSIDASSILVVYSHVYLPAIIQVMNSGNSGQYVPLSLPPTGFAILPDGREGGRGCLLTIASQFLVNINHANDDIFMAQFVKNVNNLIMDAVRNIKAALPLN